MKFPNISWKKGNEERRSADEPGSPPIRGDQIIGDGSTCPDGGYEWKGKGEPGTGQGSWVRGPRGSQERLYPDLNHPPPIDSHWDYESPDFPEGVRLFLDGTWSPK